MPSATLSWRRLLLCLLGLACLIYAVTVLAFVYSVPDLGLRSAFDTTIKKFDGTCRSDDRLKAQDRIIQLGDVRTDTWAHLLQAQNLPSKNPPIEVANLKEAEKLGRAYAK